MNIVSHKKVYFSISAGLVLASLLSLFFWGLKFGLDFTGGSLMEIEFFDERPTNQEIQEKLADLSPPAGGLGQINLQPAGEKGMILRLKDIDEETHQKIIEKIGRENIEEKRFESVGPIIGQELKRKALWAIGLALIAIALFIAWSFRKISRPVASWQYGLAAIIALLHDVLITLGLFSVLGHFYRIEIDLSFVAAVLTILGYSINDTIVVFDRSRENLLKSNWVDFEEVINQSINQTMARSINTSLTTLLALLAVFFFGGQTIRYFALALITGIFFGTYSSIFIASPLIVVWEKWKRR